MIAELKRTGRAVVDVSFPEIEKFDHLPAPRAQGASAFVSIMEGCSKYCSFCIVPYTRGDEVSRPFDAVLAEVRALAAQGVARSDAPRAERQRLCRPRRADGVTADLATLIHYIAQLPAIERIRFTTSHPLEFTPSLIEAFASVPKLANHLHLPVQSGSDRILALMKRGYTALEYKEKIRRLRASAPRCQRLFGLHHRLSGRDRARFSRRRSSLCATVGFDQSFSFIYSRRPGTPAAALPDEVPHEVKLERLARLQAQLEEQALAISRNMVGSVQRVLVEAPAKRNQAELSGRTANNRWVNFAGPRNAHKPLHRRRDHRRRAPHAARPGASRPRVLRKSRGCSHAASHLREFLLEPADNARLANLCGPLDENLRLLEVTPRRADPPARRQLPHQRRAREQRRGDAARALRPHRRRSRYPGARAPHAARARAGSAAAGRSGG